MEATNHQVLSLTGRTFAKIKPFPPHLNYSAPAVRAFLSDFDRSAQENFRSLISALSFCMLFSFLRIFLSTFNRRFSLKDAKCACNFSFSSTRLASSLINFCRTTNGSSSTLSCIEMAFSSTRAHACAFRIFCFLFKDNFNSILCHPLRYETKVINKSGVLIDGIYQKPKYQCFETVSGAHAGNFIIKLYFT